MKIILQEVCMKERSCELINYRRRFFRIVNIISSSAFLSRGFFVANVINILIINVAKRILST